PLADQSRIVRNLLFRESGTASPANAGSGFLLDGVRLSANDDCTTTCYVNGTTGDDTATGQLSDPVKTIQAGVNLVTAGGTVNVAAGTYDAATTIPKAVTLNGANVGVARNRERGRADRRRTRLHLQHHHVESGHDRRLPRPVRRHRPGWWRAELARIREPADVQEQPRRQLQLRERARQCDELGVVDLHEQQVHEHR